MVFAISITSPPMSWKLLKVLKTGEGHCAWILECRSLPSAFKKNLKPHLGCSHCGMVVLGDDELVWRIRIKINRSCKQAGNRTEQTPVFGDNPYTHGFFPLGAATFTFDGRLWALWSAQGTTGFQRWLTQSHLQEAYRCLQDQRTNSDIPSLEQENLFINRY